MTYRTDDAAKLGAAFRSIHTRGKHDSLYPPEDNLADRGCSEPVVLSESYEILQHERPLYRPRKVESLPELLKGLLNGNRQACPYSIEDHAAQFAPQSQGSVRKAGGVTRRPFHRSPRRLSHQA
jgi:hypothetical protein